MCIHCKRLMYTYYACTEANLLILEFEQTESRLAAGQTIVVKITRQLILSKLDLGLREYQGWGVCGGWGTGAVLQWI